MTLKKPNLGHEPSTRVIIRLPAKENQEFVGTGRQMVSGRCVGIEHPAKNAPPKLVLSKPACMMQKGCWKRVDSAAQHRLDQ
jgi:hypothetical protein